MSHLIIKFIVLLLTLQQYIFSRIITLAQSKPKGISDKDLTVIMPDLQPIQRAHIINNLLSKGYFDLFKQGGSLFYRLKDPK